MCYGKRGAVTERWSYRLLDQAVRLRVDRRCSLVQEQDLKKKIKTSSFKIIEVKESMYQNKSQHLIWQ